MLAFRRRLASSLFTFALVIGGVARDASAEEPQATTPAARSPEIEVAATAAYGSVRENRFDYLSQTSDKHGRAYAGLQVAARLRATPLLSLGLVASHTACERCEGERFSRAAFEAGLHVLHTRFVDAWGMADVGLAFAKFAPVQPSLCTNDECTPLYTDTQMRTRVGPEAGLGLGIDFLPVRYVSIGLETRVLAVLFDAPPGTIDAPSGPTPAIFAGLTLGAHVPL